MTCQVTHYTIEFIKCPKLNWQTTGLAHEHTSTFYLLKILNSEITFPFHIHILIIFIIYIQLFIHSNSVKMYIKLIIYQYKEPQLNLQSRATYFPKFNLSEAFGTNHDKEMKAHMMHLLIQYTLPLAVLSCYATWTPLRMQRMMLESLSHLGMWMMCKVSNKSGMLCILMGHVYS